MIVLCFLFFSYYTFLFWEILSDNIKRRYTFFLFVQVFHLGKKNELYLVLNGKYVRLGAYVNYYATTRHSLLIENFFVS